jgi:hypothetical protein
MNKNLGEKINENISSTINSIIDDYTSNIKNIEKRQEELIEEIEKLNSEILECSKHTEFINFEPKIIKLAHIKKTALIVNQNLNNITERLNRIQLEIIKKYPETYKLLQSKNKQNSENKLKTNEENKKNEFFSEDQFIPKIQDSKEEFSPMLSKRDIVNVIINIFNFRFIIKYQYFIKKEIGSWFMIQDNMV